MCILSQGSRGQGRVAGHSQLLRAIIRWLKVGRDGDLESGFSPALGGDSLVIRFFFSLSRKYSQVAKSSQNILK